MDPYIGQIMLFAGNFAPRGFAFCDGQLLSISANSELFSILGTSYGGDGRTTFALPDLRGRVPVQAGDGPGLSPYRLGEKFGTERVTLTAHEMPAHNHKLEAREANGKGEDPANNYLAKTKSAPYLDGPPDTQMGAAAIGNAGGGAAHENRPPGLALNYCIALQGLYPQRN